MGETRQHMDKDTKLPSYAERTPESVRESYRRVSPEAQLELRNTMQEWFDKNCPHAERDFSDCDTISQAFGHALDWFSYGN